MERRASTREEYSKRINLITEYINNHLNEPIDLITLAELSCFSPWHFHRIMKAYLGEPIGFFIIRTRLETAAKLLRYSDLSISEIAWQIGYDAPSSLSKAFRSLYGISPSEYRNNREFVIIKPIKIMENLNLKGPKILETEAKQAIYLKLTGNYGNLDFTGSWQRLWQYVKENKLFSAGIEHIAIYHDDPKITEADKLRTDICLVVKKEAKAKGEIGVKTIEGGRYAAFLYQGPYHQLDAVYNTIYTQWLPESGYKLRNYHCFEKYINNPAQTTPEKLKTEIYIPIE